MIFSPEVPIRLDYTGKHVDGSLSGLLLGLGQLDCSELRLKRICHRHGLLGFDKLVSFLLHEWLSDIKKINCRIYLAELDRYIHLYNFVCILKE